MKRINIIILLFVGLIGGLASTSCKKSFLEKPKGGSVTVDTIFDSKNQAQYAIAEMYYLCVRGYFPQTYDGCRPEAITDLL